jgi:pyridoxine 5-phosphate synthase
MSRIRLGVNIDHAATLRQVRGGETPYPNLLRLTEICQSAGADQITIHLREDRRHIQLSDLRELSSKCPLLLNLEMAPQDQMVSYAKKYKPDWVCFVPEKRQELTTEGGLDVASIAPKLSKQVAKLQVIGIEISMFIEPSIKQVQAAYDVGADAVEFHTGKWVRLMGRSRKKEWARLVSAAKLAHSLGLSVHAGHGLDFDSAAEMTKLPYLQELNIGHSLICHSLEMGLGAAVKKMRSKMKRT